MSGRPENRQWLVAETPPDRLRPDHFLLRSAPRPEPGAGEVLIRSLWLSIDAAGRTWMQGRSYRDQVLPGDLMPGFGIGEVVATGEPRLPVGTLVTGDIGWQDLAVLSGSAVQVVAPRANLSQHLSVLGLTGLTAWVGLLDIGRAEPGQTVVVSAAAGATGNLVGQLARRHGCRVVGIAGSADKCRWLTDVLGFDAVVSHRDPDVRQRLREACPDGIDVYFDNVGGDLLDTVIGRMGLHGRVVCCGAISQYDSGGAPRGPSTVPGQLITRRLSMTGFLVMDHADRFAVALADLDAALADGSLIATTDVLEGLERAPEALVGLLAGDNVGKRLVHIADPA